ncbi:photosynthetic reaction center H subunit [Roseospira visakhapatnamensis]|uniref:Photosynthetic reaction center H subunit n=1 Tax=Roseospira visakhapatnamensis TaxID=390880 RepID=A0A7W6RF64_9PROT|nr:photosynthetic reaction center H subunit [Roseospira visakhapatnamensis]
MTLYVFWFFFAALIFYLRREDRREGYPLEYDVSGKIEKTGWFWMPPAKTFNLFHGGTSVAPDYKRDTRPLKAKRVAPWPGSPFEPTGTNPLADCIGPASYAEREDKPELTLENTPKIVPMRAAKDFSVESSGPDPRGMTVIGSDGQAAGTITDIWVDTAETFVRYFEVQLGSAAPAPSLATKGGKAPAKGAAPAAPAGKMVLLPVNFAHIDKGTRTVSVSAIPAGRFAQVPATAQPNQVTKLEEDKISAYFGGGFLLA